MRTYPTTRVEVLGWEKVVMRALMPRLLYEWKSYLASAPPPPPPFSTSASNLAWNSLRMSSAVSRFQGRVCT